MLPERRATLSRLLGTWGSGVFPADVLERVKARMVSAAPPQQPQIILQQAAQPMQVVHVAQGGYGAQPQVVALPPTTYGMQQVMHLMPPVQQHYAPQQQPITVVLQQPGVPPSPQHHAHAWQHQQQQQHAMHQQHQRQRSPSPYGQFQQPGGVPTNLSDLLSSLAQTGVLKGAGACPQDDPALKTTELTPAFIKVNALRAPTLTPLSALPPSLHPPQLARFGVCAACC